MNGDAAIAACCGPERPGGREEAPGSAHPQHDLQARSDHLASMVLLEGGTFLMGTDDPTFPGDGEGPVRERSVGPFRIDRYAVSNTRFARFVEATGYCTDAERFGWSFVFRGFVDRVHAGVRRVAAAPWWLQIDGASWRLPEGPGSSLEERLGHPVVHVSWNDAVAYASWAGGRLPSEAEWEFAARGGLVQKRYPWGDRFVPGGRHRCNTWQGTFPKNNTVKDGYPGTAPVDAFEPNGFGLYNVAGNVWEWCTDAWSVAAGPGSPRGQAKGAEEGGGSRVIRGGSYLCHSSYCNRYRVAARTHNTADSSTGHMGFRLVMDV